MNPRGLSKRMAVDGFLPEEIGMVVNTHSHIDHTREIGFLEGGVQRFLSASENISI
jgi:phosphoribosyl 1,2-cyclic phosphodiesterase